MQCATALKFNRKTHLVHLVLPSCPEPLGSSLWSPPTVQEIDLHLSLPCWPYRWHPEARVPWHLADRQSLQFHLRSRWWRSNLKRSYLQRRRAPPVRQAAFHFHQSLEQSSKSWQTKRMSTRLFRARHCSLNRLYWAIVSGHRQECWAHSAAKMPHCHRSCHRLESRHGWKQCRDRITLPFRWQPSQQSRTFLNTLGICKQSSLSFHRSGASLDHQVCQCAFMSAHTSTGRRKRIDSRPYVDRSGAAQSKIRNSPELLSLLVYAIDWQALKFESTLTISTNRAYWERFKSTHLRSWQQNWAR